MGLQSAAGSLAAGQQRQQPEDSTTGTVRARGCEGDWAYYGRPAFLAPAMVPREFQQSMSPEPSDDGYEAEGGGEPAPQLSPSTVAILEAAAKFLFTDELQASLAAFTANHASMFSGATGVEGEHRLEWSEAHRDFQGLFEFQLEQFIAAQPFEAEDFVAACQDALDHGTWSNQKGLVQVVLSMTTYEYFVRMMSQAAAAEEYGEPPAAAAEDARDMMSLALDMD